MSDTVEQILRRLGSRYESLTPQLRRAAQYLLDNPNEIGVSSIRQLAGAAGVKPNALVRLAQALELESYEALREPFREQLLHGPPTYPGRARWLQSLARGGSHGQLYSQMAAASLANIEQLFATTSSDQLKTVADRLVAARRVLVLGAGSCHWLARQFCYVAGMGFEHIRPVSGGGYHPMDDLAVLNPGDILLAMTFSPYRAEVVDTARLARERGVELIAITDSRASPIALEADTVFLVPVTTPQFFLSAAAVQALLEALLAFMVADAEPDVVARIEAIHQLRFDSGVYRSEDE